MYLTHIGLEYGKNIFFFVRSNYTSGIAIVGLTSFIIQLFTKVRCHCKESECAYNCYDKIKQIMSPPTPRLRRMISIAE